MSETTLTFPNGDTLTDVSFSEPEFATFMQTFTAQLFAADLSKKDSIGWALFRVDFPPAGQPGFLQSEDVCFVRCSLADDSWGDIFETDGGWEPGGYGAGDFGTGAYGAGDVAVASQTIQQQRVWAVRWEFYGPNSFQRAMLLRSALFTDWADGTLAKSNLALVTEVPRPVRAPELFQGHWWDRSDLAARFNEGITQTVSVPAGASVDISVGGGNGNLAGVTVLQPASTGE